MSPSHYLNQYWPPIGQVLRHSAESNFTVHDQAPILYDEFENDTFKTTTTILI